MEILSSSVELGSYSAPVRKARGIFHKVVYDLSVRLVNLPFIRLYVDEGHGMGAVGNQSPASIHSVGLAASSTHATVPFRPPMVAVSS